MEYLLQQTLDLYSDSWKKEHEEVMRKYEHADGLCEGIKFGTFLFDQLEHAMAKGLTDTCEGVAKALPAFTGWYQTSSAVLSAIESSEDDDYPVELADELRSRHARAGAILEDLQDAARAIESINSNRGTTLAGFLHELRNPVHGGL